MDCPTSDKVNVGMCSLSTKTESCAWNFVPRETSKLGRHQWAFLIEPSHPRRVLSWKLSWIQSSIRNNHLFHSSKCIKKQKILFFWNRNELKEPWGGYVPEQCFHFNFKINCLHSYQLTKRLPGVGYRKNWWQNQGCVATARLKPIDDQNNSGPPSNLMVIN